MKRLAKKVMSDLEDLGFDLIWRNNSGDYVYVHADDPQQTEVRVSPSIDENAAKATVARCRRIAGIAPVIVKRRGEQVKERDAADRAREREQAERRLRWAEEKRDRLLADMAEAAYVAKVEELVEHRRRELAELHREMTETPQGGQHVGTGRVDVFTSGAPL